MRVQTRPRAKPVPPLLSERSVCTGITVKNIALVALLVASLPSHASCLWTDNGWTNTAIVSANALLLRDWGQTRYIADHPERYREVGIAENFIGQHPTSGQVNKYFVSSIVATNVVGCLLPDHWKTGFYTGVAAFQFKVTEDNAEIGIGFKF